MSIPSGTPDPRIEEAEKSVAKLNYQLSIEGLVNFSGTFTPAGSIGWEHVAGPWWYDSRCYNPPLDRVRPLSLLAMQAHETLLRLRYPRDYE